ncbi:uncharacterized protein LOC143022282 [Oratosquilla oratoria]|uniref:uncharacterized protein LOC143022282 n=1 Tax=Oratosquilla oratoria TaxID=337810 RepID=UPI003F765659
MEGLKSQLVPLETALDHTNHQIKKLEEELNETRLSMAARERQVKELSHRLQTSHSQGRVQNHRIHTLSTSMTRLLAEISNAATNVHNPKKLKDAIKTMNERYGADQRAASASWAPRELQKDRPQLTTLEGQDLPKLEGSVATAGESEAIEELLKQRRVLERTVSTHQAQLQKVTRAHKSRVASLVKENKDLLDSCAQLERDSWRLRQTVRQLESVLGVPTSRICSSRGGSGSAAGGAVAATKGPVSHKGRRSSRQQLVETVALQADTISRLQADLRLVRLQVEESKEANVSENADVQENTNKEEEKEDLNAVEGENPDKDQTSGGDAIKEEEEAKMSPVDDNTITDSV